MTNLGERYLEQSIIVESAEGTWVQATRAADGAHVIGLALSGQTSPKAAEAAEAARAVASKGSPFVAQLAEASSTSLVWGPVGPKRLSDLVKQRGGLPVDRVIDAAHQIAQALAAAEAAGVPHHDLHPRAIGVLDGGDAGMLIRVAGFGAAKLLPLYSTTKKSDAFHGSPEYMAPEVCGGKGADHRSDIYALGIIMYEMVTVKPPFLSNNINTTIKRQIYEKPLPLHLVKPGVEHISDFEKVVLRAVEKDPKKRFQSAADLVAALETLRDDLFPTLVFSDPAQVQTRAEERAAAPDAGPGDFIPASAEDITSRKHGTLVFSGLGQTFDLDEEEDRAAAPAAAAQAAPGKPGTQIFSGLGDLIDEDDDEDDDARANPALVGGVAAHEPESFAVASAPAQLADSDEPVGETEPTSIVVVGHAAPMEEERTAVIPEPEGARRQTMMFDPRVGMDVRAAASHVPVADEAEEAEDDLASAGPVEEAAKPTRTMLFEAVKEDAPRQEAASTTGAPEAADRTQVDVRHAEMVSWAANQPPRQRAKSEEMEAWFVDASTDAGEPEDPYTLAEGKKSTRKFMIVMGVVTVVLVVFVAMFLDTGSDEPKPRKGAGAPPAKIGQEGQAAASGAGAVVPDVPTQTPEQIQASGLVKLGDEALGRQELGGARVLYENALKVDPASDGAKAGLEKVAEIEAQQAAAADAGAAVEPDSGGGSQGGAVAGSEAAAAEAAAAEAASAKAAEEAAATAAAAEAAAQRAAAEAAAQRAADEAAAKRAADEAASAGAAEAVAAKRAAEEAAAAKAAEAAAAKKAAEEAAAAKAAEAAAAKKAAEEAAAAKAAEAAAAKAAQAAAAKKAAEEAAAKKAAQGTSEKGVVDEAAAKKAAEAAAAKKAAAAEAKRLAAEEAAAKKAAEAAKKAAEGNTKAGTAEAAKNPEEESAKLVKLGIGAMKSGNNPLALKYFNKAKTLNPANAMIQKYIEKASQ